MPFTRRSALGLLLSFSTLLAGTEWFCRQADRSGFWYRHFDFSGSLTSLAETEDRLSWGTRLPHPLFLLGDSVLGPTALMEHRVSGARSIALGADLSRLAGRDGFSVVNLGADGMLVPDLKALAAQFERYRPERLVLVLNFRMFAPEFDGGTSAASRPFLEMSREDAPAPLPVESGIHGLWKALHDDPGARIEIWALRHWHTLRTTTLLKTLWYSPSQKDAFQKLLERFWRSPDDQDDLKEAALQLKAAAFYPSRAWDPHAIPLATLGPLLDLLDKYRVPTLVVLTPQNTAFLGESFSRPAFTENRRRMKETVERPARRFIRYRDWAALCPAQMFLDHCHLTAEGNEFLAGKILSELETKP